MARFASKSKIRPEIPMAAMSDVAFLLIIFFLVTSSFSRPSRLPIELPGEKPADAADAKPSPPPTVRVETVGVYLNDQPLQLWQVSTDLRSLLSQKALASDRVVVLRAAAGVNMERVVEAMDAIRQADAHVGFLEVDQP